MTYLNSIDIHIRTYEPFKTNNRIQTNQNKKPTVIKKLKEKSDSISNKESNLKSDSILVDAWSI